MKKPVEQQPKIVMIDSSKLPDHAEPDPQLRLTLLAQVLITSPTFKQKR